MSRVLLVEDDPVLGQSLKLNLEVGGFDVEWAKSLKEADTVNASRSLDLVLLDLGLPDGNGMTFCKKLRHAGSRLPVIILTAQADEDSVVEGLSSGANDYVKKPYSNKELLARMKAALRVPILREDQTRVGNVLILHEQRRVLIEGEEISLNRREFDLFKILSRQPGAVITRESILEQLSSSDEIFDRTVDSHVSHLRSKLKKVEGCNVGIKSEYGVGYRLVVYD